MATKTKQIIIGLLVILIASAITITMMGENVRLKIENTKTTFYVYENNSWITSGIETNYLYNGTKTIPKDLLNFAKIEYINTSTMFKVTRTQNYGRTKILDTYTFSGVNTAVELFPISHTIEIINGSGLKYKYAASSLYYTGPTISNVKSPQKFGKNMEIAWVNGTAKLTKLTGGKGKLEINYKVNSDYEKYDIRLFDPEGQSLCYQETANVSTSCGGLSSGSYSWKNISKEGFFYINYTKPIKAVSSSTWRVKYYQNMYDNQTIDFSIPDACWNAYSDKLSFRETSVGGPISHSDYDCWNGTDWYNLHTTTGLGPVTGGTAATSSDPPYRAFDGNWNTCSAWMSSEFGIMYWSNRGNCPDYFPYQLALVEEAMNWELDGSSSFFISTWNTENAGSATKTIVLPITGNYQVDWGDGNSTINQTTHVYATTGIKTINIAGDITGFRFNNGGDKAKIINISQWGDLHLGNSDGYFYGCSNLNLTTVSDTLNLSGTTSLEGMFNGATSITTINNLNSWDTSSITAMDSMFFGATAFNQNLSTWNTSSVTGTGFSSMFYGATNFNGDLSGWTFNPNVNSLANMFRSSAFNNPSVSNWNFTSITTLALNAMFYNATSFNQPLNWDVSKVTTTASMFMYDVNFDQNLGNWNVSSITTATNMLNMSGISTANYNSLLNGWASRTLKNNTRLDAGTVKYSSAALTNRTYIISTFNWTITDGGQCPVPDIDYKVVVNSGFLRFLNCSPDFENPISIPQGQTSSLNSINATNNGTGSANLQIRINQTAATGWKLYATNQSDLSQNLTLNTTWQTIYGGVSDGLYRKIWLFANCSYISSNPRTSIEMRAV